MKLEVQWLAYLATQEGILDSAKCLVLKHAVGPEADLLAFGEKMLDRGYCLDFDQIQELVNQAFEKSENEDPVPSNPFEVLGAPIESKVSLSNKSAPNDFSNESNSNLHLSSLPTLNANTAELTTPPESKWNPSIVRKGYTDPPFSSGLTATPLEPAPTLESTPTPGSVPPPVAALEEPPSTPTPESQLSKERPNVSFDVEADWPDFTAVGAMSESELRDSMVQLLLVSQGAGASDLHLSADARPFIRYNRMVTYLGDYSLTKEDSEKLNTALLSEFQKHEFNSKHDLDYALALDLNHRYRVNLMEHKDGPSGTYRIVPSEILTLEELGFSETDTIKNLLSYHNGLIMVTGPMGSGKTTTLAALVDELNRTRQDHLITVESPIEIVQQSRECQITQREVGSHTRTFHSALKGALRQDPDIIVIGEMRDLETVEMAISASETGHLVIGTMHTSDAGNTLNRLLDVFPAAQQSQIRSMVAESLKGIICQRLLPSTEGGVALAYELLLNNAAVGNLIRTNKADGLSNIIETGRKEGMVLMDKSIFALWEAGRISDEVAIANLISAPMKHQIKNQFHIPEAPDEDSAKKKRFSFRK